MQTKRVSDSSVTMVQQMTQQDANLAGNVHGGVIMRLIDNTAGIVAIRHSQMNCVTATIDRLDFHHPVFVGDILRIAASINFTGKSSMEVGVRVEAENMISGEVRHTASAYLTFVALDAQGKPAQVPAIVFESKEERRRNCESLMRRENRLREKTHEKKGECEPKE